MTGCLAMSMPKAEADAEHHVTAVTRTEDMQADLACIRIC